MSGKNFDLWTVVLVALQLNVQSADRREFEQLIEHMMGRRISMLPGATLKPYVKACSDSLKRQHPKLNNVTMPTLNNDVKIKTFLDEHRQTLGSKLSVKPLEESEVRRLLMK